MGEEKKSKPIEWVDLVVKVATLCFVAAYTVYSCQQKNAAIDAVTAANKAVGAANQAVGEANRQANEMVTQTPYVEKAANAAKSAAETAANQLAEMAKQTTGVIEAAKAATSAANTAEKALVDVERPLLVLNIENTPIIPIPPFPLAPELADGIPVPVKISTQNTGKQSAIITSWRVRFWFAKNVSPTIPEDLIKDSFVQGPGGPNSRDICVGPENDIPDPIVQPNGRPYVITCNGLFMPRDIELLNLKSGAEGSVWLQWLISYTDALDVGRENAGTWRFLSGHPERGERGFTTWGGQAYNYDRRIKQ